MASTVSITVRARDLTQDAFRSIERSASRLGSGMGTLFGRMASLSESFGTRIQSVGTSLSGLAQGPHGAVLKLVAVLTLLPIVAQAAAIGITLGLGGAIAGIGIMAAAQSRQVQDAFKEMKDNVSSSLSNLAKPLEPALVQIAGSIEGIFNTLAPSLGAAFEAMAPELTSFVSKIAVGMESFQGTIGTVTAAFGPLMDVLGNQLQRMIEHLAEDFEILAEVADPRFVTILIGAFTGLFDAITLVITGFALAGSAFVDLIDLIPGVNFDKGAASADELADSADDAAVAFGKLNDKMLENANFQLGASGAAINFEAAIDKATAALKKNGKNLDLNTPKGRDNMEMLNGVASSALQMGQKLDEAGISSSESMARARASFIKLARGMGATQADAAAVADKFGLIKQSVEAVPGKSTVKIFDNAGQAKSRVDSFRNRLLGIPDKTVRITVITSSIKPVGATGSAGPPGASLPGHAAGGPAGGTTWVGENGPELVNLPYGSHVNPARSAGGGGGSIGSAISQMGSIGKTAAVALKQLLDAMDGKITTIRSKFNAVISIIKQKFDGNQEDALVAYSKKQLAALEKLAVKRDKIAEKLKVAKDFAKDIAQTAMGTASLSGLGATSGLGIKLGLENKLAKMRSFATALKALAKKGLAAALFRQIAELGPDGGLELAQDFLAMDAKTFAQTNAIQGQISKAAGQIGTNAAEQLYGTKAIEKQVAVQQKAMDKIADRFADKIAAALLKVAGKSKSKKAGGGPAGGYTLVGEEGPEILNLPYGSSVMTAGATRRMAGSGGSSGGAVQLEWVGGNAGDEFMTWLKKNIRAAAGSGPNSVQIALS